MPATAKPMPSTPSVATPNAGLSLGGEAIRRANARARKSGLLIDAARQFCSISRPTRNDLVVFKELFYQLLDGADKSERRLLSATLARNPYTPRTILYCLALDEPDIAAPVLMFCEAINEFDIVQLAKRLPLLSLEIMCRRTVLTPTAVRALIKHGGESCRTLIARNPAFFEDTTIQAIIAGLEVQQEEPVVVLPVRMTNRTAPVIAAQQAAPLEPSLPVDQLLANASRGGRLGRQQSPQSQQSQQSQQARTVPAFDPMRPIEPQLIRAIRIRDTISLATRLEEWCGIKPFASLAILEKGGISERIVLFKGLGLSHLGTMQCLMQLVPGLGRDAHAYGEARRLLKELDENQCRAIVRTLGANFDIAARKPVGKEQLAQAITQAAAMRRREINQVATAKPAPAASESPRRTAGLLSIL